ncbi:hypothetical protein SNEBB_009146 [Seison nebaliae]|nr:hypothetical protein SNEBB_009146 [Seison nebaliae]
MYGDIEISAGYYVNKVIGQGAQGTIYQITNGRKPVKVLKVMEDPSTYLFELNALYSKMHHRIPRLPQYDLLDIAATENIGNGYTYDLDTIIFKGKLKKRCLVADFVDGIMVSTGGMNLYRTLNASVRGFLMFFITLMKQIQAIHFTINHFPFTHGTKILHNIANAHADLHMANIFLIMAQFRNGQPMIQPLLLDYGLAAEFFYKSADDIVTEVYNNNLREENGIREENRISADRIYNLFQNVDFTQIMALMVYAFLTLTMSTVYYFAVELRNILEKEKGLDYLRRMELFQNVPDELKEIIPLMRLMCEGIKSRQTYRHWMRIVDLLTPEEIMDAPLPNQYKTDLPIRQEIEFYEIDSSSEGTVAGDNVTFSGSSGGSDNTLNKESYNDEDGNGDNNDDIDDDYMKILNNLVRG